MGLLYHISVVRSISMSVRCAIALCAMILSCGTQALCAPITNHSVEYPYIIYVDSAYIPVLDNEEFQSVAATVIFPVNKTALPADSPVLVELNDDVLPMLNSDSIEALRIDLRGAASPEGTLPRNTYLGEARMRALLSFVQNRLDVPLKDADMRMLSEAEDYLTLAMLMREAGDKDYDRVKELCDRYLPAGRYDAMKRELRAVDDGRLWHRLLSTYYPQLRTAQLVIYCKRKTDERRVRPTHLPLRVFNTAALPGKVDFTFGPKRYPRRELLSVKTNLLLYGVYMPGGYDKWCPIPISLLSTIPCTAISPTSARSTARGGKTTGDTNISRFATISSRRATTCAAATSATIRRVRVPPSAACTCRAMPMLPCTACALMPTAVG